MREGSIPSPSAMIPSLHLANKLNADGYEREWLQDRGMRDYWIIGLQGYEGYLFGVPEYF
jgi:hypothetical protein